jgi:RecA-family ATPase
MLAEQLGTILTKDLPTLDELIGKGILVRGGKLVLYGAFKAGKSTLLTYISLCLAGGIPLFGDKSYATKVCKVYYLQLEMPYLAYVKRLKETKLTGVESIQRNFFTATKFWLKIDKDEGFAWLDRELGEVQPDVLVIDPLYKCLSGNENVSQDMTEIFDRLDALLEKHGVALLFTMQGRKAHVNQRGFAVDMGDAELRGSTASGGWVDSILGIRRKEGTHRKITCTLRHGEDVSLAIDVIWDKATGLYLLK